MEENEKPQVIQELEYRIMVRQIAVNIMQYVVDSVGSEPFGAEDVYYYFVANEKPVQTKDKIYDYLNSLWRDHIVLKTEHRYCPIERFQINMDRR